MPSKKRYNARFPPARIKKIMQTDEEIGKVAAPVPIIISRALELFLEQILNKSSQIVASRSAKTLSRAHIKHAVMSESTFDFLKDLVADIEDIPEVEETKEPAPKNNNTTNKNSSGKRRGRPRKVLREESSDDCDEDVKTECEDKPAHGRRDIMLPMVVNVDDDQSDVKELDTCSSDSVASLPVPIATPMASPNTMAPAIAETIATVAPHNDEDDDYDS